MGFKPDFTGAKLRPTAVGGRWGFKSEFTGAKHRPTAVVGQWGIKSDFTGAKRRPTAIGGGVGFKPDFTGTKRRPTAVGVRWVKTWFTGAKHCPTVVRGKWGLNLILLVPNAPYSCRRKRRFKPDLIGSKRRPTAVGRGIKTWIYWLQKSPYSCRIEMGI